MQLQIWLTLRLMKTQAKIMKVMVVINSSKVENANFVVLVMVGPIFAHAIVQPVNSETSMTIVEIAITSVIAI